MTDPRTQAKDGAAAMLKALNEHGHAFAATVLKRAHASNQGSGKWLLRASEFAGELRGRVFHIDGVLQCTHASRPEMIFAAIECKRADPAVARWCFIRSSAMRGDGFAREVIFERYNTPERTLSAASIYGNAVQTNATKEAIYQLGLELRTNATGSGLGRALNDAISQACRGASGLVARLPEWMTPGGFAFVIPVIATTAELLVSDDDLASADLIKGDIPKSRITTKEVPWLWYETHLTPDLSPVATRQTNAVDKRDPVGFALDHHQTRAVMITRGTEIRSALEEVALALSSLDSVRST